MATSITLNSVAINTGNYAVTRILHDSSPVMDINALEINRRDGAELISTNYKPKEITIEGWLTQTTQALLEDLIDDTKRDLVKSNINLDIAYAGATRRYVVTAKSFSITRENYDITRVRYTLSLICLTPFAISPTEVEALSVVNITSASYETTMTVDGSSLPQPTINYTIDLAGNLGKLTFTNNTTGKQIEVGTAFGSGDLLTINCEDRTVKLNSQDVEFEGVFPTFDIGVNRIITTASLSSIALEQANSDTDVFFSAISPIFDKDRAQTFSAPASTTYKYISVMIKKIGSPIGTLTCEVRTTSGGLPTATVITNGSATALVSSVSDNFGWVTFTFTIPFTLVSGTTYAIVLREVGGDGVSYYKWAVSGANPYSNGSLYYYDSGKGGSWNIESGYDGTFIMYYDQSATYSFDWEINYYPKYL